MADERPTLFVQEFYEDGQMKTHLEIRMHARKQFPKWVVLMSAIACLTTVVTFIAHFNYAPSNTSDPTRSSRENTKTSTPITRVQTEY